MRNIGILKLCSLGVYDPDLRKDHVLPEHQLRDGAQIAQPDYFNYFLNIDVKVSPNSGLPWHVTVIHAMGRCFIGCMRLKSCWVRFPARMMAATKGPLR